MEVNVEYQVPVIAVVDTQTKEVVSVHVVDEEIGTPTGAYNPASTRQLTANQKAKAYEIAESKWWPGWEFGF